EAARRHPRRAGPDERFVDLTPDPLAGVGPDALAAALVAALTPRPVPQLTTEHIRVPAATVQDCVADLVARLPECGPVSFRELTGHITDRVVVVAHFLALLELFKLGYADLTQAERFGDIGVRWIADAAGVDVDAVLAAVARDAVAA
ncbi:MAG TPA: segregation/condensation protein A, partial [Acidimicrobiaceae bacterium]|nr:segregation/condensation protein A [Acidimicrobiaceae bacterium]